jgi:L-ascorbate metabolism protein UlaG (beta-lactamase superfamily)
MRSAFLFRWPVLLVALSLSACLAAPRYRGPVTDHFNGRTFVNQGGVKSSQGVMKWLLHRDKGPWPENKFTEVTYGPRPPARVGRGQLRVTFVNHGTFLLQFNSLNILTDPIWSQRCSPVQWTGPQRKRPPGLRFEDLPSIDAVLISHNHYDHLDLPTLRRLAARDQPLLVAGLGVKALLDKKGLPNTVELDWWQSRNLGHSVKLVCTPAQHFSGRGLRDKDAELWVSYALQTSNGPLYYAGDTGYGPHFRQIRERLGPIRLAILPIGAYRPQWFMAPIHVAPAQAVEALRDLGLPRGVATHFGTFQLADDGLTEPVEDLRKVLRQAQLPDSAFLVLPEGLGWQLH